MHSSTTQEVDAKLTTINETAKDNQKLQGLVSQLQEETQHLKHELNKQRTVAEEAQQRFEALARGRNEALHRAVTECTAQQERIGMLSTQVQQLERTVQEQQQRLQDMEGLQRTLQTMLADQSQYGAGI